MSCNDYSFYAKKFELHLVIVYAYLWLQAVPHDYTNITSMGFTKVIKFIG